MANYWKIELSELPSKGYFYNEGAEIHLRLFSLEEIKFLDTMNEHTAENLVNSLIKKCAIFVNLDFNDLLLCDREHLAFWLRMNSFIQGSGYVLNVSKCEGCGKSFEKEISLEDFDIKYLEKPPEPLELPDCGKVVDIKLPCVRDLKIKCRDEETQFAARCIRNANNPELFINSLSAFDYRYLMSEVEELKLGFVRKLMVPCPFCGHYHTVLIKISDEGLFGNISIMNVIEKITRMSKYLGCNIPNDTPWMEIELQHEVINKMIEEENKEAARQESIAKSKANSYHARKPSVPHH